MTRSVELLIVIENDIYLSLSSRVMSLSLLDPPRGPFLGLGLPPSALQQPSLCDLLLGQLVFLWFSSSHLKLFTHRMDSQLSSLSSFGPEAVEC